jgi:lipoate-protein ligase A
MTTPKVHGYLLVRKDTDQPFLYFPIDGTKAEFYRIDEVPEAVASAGDELANANEATVIGVIADLPHAA